MFMNLMIILKKKIELRRRRVRMVRQKPKPWDMHEATILLDAVVRVYEGKADRKTAIAEVSGKLRSMAVKGGLEIDEIYRNIAGITFQMYSMESAYVGHTMRKPATKLFLEIVKMMQEEPHEYEKILQEAKELIGEDRSIEEKYLSCYLQRFPVHKCLNCIWYTQK